jgi:hypothetical protein
MRATTKKPDIRFIVDVTPKNDSYSGRSLALTVTPVIIDEAGKIRNPDSASEYEGLMVESNLYDSNTDFFLGYDFVRFDIYRIDARRAESLVKTFRRLQKCFAALDEKWGRPDDTTDTLARLADAVRGSVGFCFGRCTTKGGWSYDDNEYRWMDVDGLRSWLQQQIKEWKGDE